MRLGFLISFMLSVASATACAAVNLLEYDTKYYKVYTDLPRDNAREACIRMTKMAELYSSRTSDFSGAITQRLPFYLYKNASDYYASGAPAGSAGYFNGVELVAMAQRMDARTWHTVQHEGFHQFVHAVIRGNIPIWVNEGMAEYFGEAIFTGDGFVSGVIPQWRLQRIRKEIASGRFRPLTEMMALSHEQWNAEMAIENYDQGWAMIQFLAHGENNKYQRAFGSFMGEIGSGRSWQDAWADTFGDTTGFETRWRDYWTKLPDNPTIELYAQATTATWTSFFARAWVQQQKFDSFDDFAAAAKKGELKSSPEDWLPPSLLSDASDDTDALKKHGYTFTITLRPGERTPQLICTMPDGRQIIGKFAILGGKAAQVKADIVGKKR